MYKIIPFALVFLGEALAIYSEIGIAKTLNAPTFIKMSLVMIISGFCLMGGYALGVKYLNNIWVVGAISFASIIITEPLISYAIFRTLPSKGALIGLVFGVLGILSALYIK